MAEFWGDGGEAVLCGLECLVELCALFGGLCEEVVAFPCDLGFGAGFEGFREALECGDAVGVSVVEQADVSVEGVALCGEVLDQCLPVLRFGGGR